MKSWSYPNPKEGERQALAFHPCLGRKQTPFPLALLSKSVIFLLGLMASFIPGSLSQGRHQIKQTIRSGG
jgi:hypothetical protein